MIIECLYCESKVDGLLKGEHESYDPNEDPFPFKAVLVQCPVCNNPLLGGTELIQVGPSKHEWSSLNRLWPKQESHVDWDIPEIARNSLIEARICYKAKAYSASVVMSGRTLEGVCKHYSAKNKTLSVGLKELKEKGIIDERLFKWGEELRKQRNVGAHASDEKISKEDAKDLLDFVNAICEYVFVLTEKFNKFMERKSKT
ncbi:MAG: DUF4145 domain-containing protein [Pseudomonadota bacterium]